MTPAQVEKFLDLRENMGASEFKNLLAAFRNLPDILKAYSLGKQIEFQNGKGQWVEETNYSFYCTPESYRVAVPPPKPREFTLSVFSDGSVREGNWGTPELITVVEKLP